MQIIKHKLDNILVVSIVFESQDDIESVRALGGGLNVRRCIQVHSLTPTAPVKPASDLMLALDNILTPLSNLIDPKLT